MRRVRQLWLSALCVVVGVGVSAPGAAAGSYIVNSCQATSSRSFAAWSISVRPGEMVTAGSNCGIGQGTQTQYYDLREAAALVASTGGSALQAAAGNIAVAQLTAPPAAAIRGIAYRRHIDAANDEFWPGLYADAAVTERCVVTVQSPDCTALASDGDNRAFSFSPGVHQLTLGLTCGNPPCAYGFGTVPAAVIAIYSSEVTIEENTPPTLSPFTITGGSQGFVNGDAVVSFGGSDTLGIRKLEVLRGDDVAATVDGVCVDWSVLPCSEPSAGLGTGASGTKKISDLRLLTGRKTDLRVRATDGAGNVTTSAATTLEYDPDGYTVRNAAGTGLSNAEQRSLRWNAFGDGAPVTSSTAHLCIGTGPAPSDCRDVAVDPQGPLTFSLPNDGSTATAQITITDAAGNTTTSDSYAFSRDASAPAAPSVYLAGASGTDRLVSIGGEAGSQIHAKVCAVGGACTEIPAATAPAVVTAPLPNPGDYDVTATLSDAAGNVSAPTTLRVNRPKPEAEAKSLNLKVRVRSDLRKRTITVSGSVAKHAASRIDLKITGKSASGKTITQTIKLSLTKRGTFSKRLTLPARASRKRPVQLVFIPKARAGYRATRYTHTIKPH